MLRREHPLAIPVHGHLVKLPRQSYHQGMSYHELVSRLRAIRRRFLSILITWSVVSMLAAVGLWTIASSAGVTDGPRALLGGLAAQCFIWSVWDAILVAMGLSAKRWRSEPLRDPAGPFDFGELRVAAQLVRLLGFRHKVNYVWLLVGLALLLPGVVLNMPALAGHGIGVLLQAGFLLSFGRSFARHMQQALPPGAPGG
jgi:hypothetical protein